MRNHLLVLALSTATLTACAGGSAGSSSSVSSESNSSHATMSSSSLGISSSAPAASSEAIESSASSDATSSSATNISSSELASSSIGASSSEGDSSSESSSVDSSSVSSSASSESNESSTASSSSELTSSSSSELASSSSSNLSSLSSTESSSSTQSSSSSSYDTVGNITIHSPEAYAFIDEDTPLEVIASGFEWAEGPVWSAAGGFLLFSDVPENTAYKWHPQEGLSRFLRPSGSTGLHFGDGSQGSNGMAINAMDELIIAQTGDRRVAKMAASLEAPDEVYETLIDNFEGDRLNSPNDLTIASSGDIYFTDPTYGLPSGNQELRHQGVYRLDTAGEIKLVIDDHNQPNGIGLSPAEDILYVTDHQLYAYDLASDATASNRRRVIANTSPYEEFSDEGGFDGLHIHSNGTIFTSGPGGIWVVAPSGEVLAVLRTGERTANCTLSDDEKTLYITADMLLIRVKLK